MIFLIFLLGFIIRLINLNQSLWLDEAITAIALKNFGPLEIVTKFSPGDFHPPLYYLFLKFWTNFFGFSEIALRAPSIIFSLGTGIFVYLIAKKLATKKIALIATLLWMLNPLSVYYAQETRMYSLVTMAVAGSVWFFLEKKWQWFVVFFAIAVWSDYLPVLMIPVFLFLSKDNKRFLSLLPLLFLMPLFSIQFQNGLTASSSSWGNILGRADLKSLSLVFVKFSTGRIPTEIWMTPILIFYSIILFRARERLLWLWFVAPIVIGFLISFFIPVFSYFRFLFILPAFVLLLALGTRGKIWLTIPIVVISLICISMFNLTSNYQREDWRSAAVYIKSDPGQVVFPSDAQSAPLVYYGVNLKNKTESPVYLMRYVQEIFDPADNKRRNLEQSGYEKSEERGFNGVLIWKYIISRNKVF